MQPYSRDNLRDSSQRSNSGRARGPAFKRPFFTWRPGQMAHNGYRAGKRRTRRQARKEIERELDAMTSEREPARSKRRAPSIVDQPHHDAYDDDMLLLDQMDDEYYDEYYWRVEFVDEEFYEDSQRCDYCGDYWCDLRTCRSDPAWVTRWVDDVTIDDGREDEWSSVFGLYEDDYDCEQYEGEGEFSASHDTLPEPPCVGLDYEDAVERERAGERYWRTYRRVSDVHTATGLVLARGSRKVRR